MSDQSDDHFGEVVPRRLYVGDCHYLSSEIVQSGLLEIGVTHIFDCMDHSERSRLYEDDRFADPDGRFQIFHFSSDDDGSKREVGYFEQIIEQATDILSTPDCTIFCHCLVGSNRGPSAAYAILRGCMAYSAKEAEAMVLAARPHAGMAYTDCADEAIERLRGRNR